MWLKTEFIGTQWEEPRDLNADVRVIDVVKLMRQTLVQMVPDAPTLELEDALFSAVAVCDAYVKDAAQKGLF